MPTCGATLAALSAGCGRMKAYLLVCPSWYACKNKWETGTAYDHNRLDGILRVGIDLLSAECSLHSRKSELEEAENVRNDDKQDVQLV